MIPDIDTVPFSNQNAHFLRDPDIHSDVTSARPPHQYQYIHTPVAYLPRTLSHVHSEFLPKIHCLSILCQWKWNPLRVPASVPLFPAYVV